MSRFTRTALMIGVSLFAVGACGSDDESSDPTVAATTVSAPDPTAATSSTEAIDTSTTTATNLGPTASAAPGSFSVEAANGTVTLDARPTKIVSLAPTHTENLFAIGAGDQVVAVDDQSNFPAEAAAVASDLSGYTPNVEAIAAYEPDLVVIGDDDSGLGEQLTAAGITYWSGPAADTLDDVYDEIKQLGVLTGHFPEARALVATMQADIDEILAEVPESEVPLTYYHELDSTYFSVISSTFIGQIYSLAGLQNIADTAEASSDYPQLSSELIVSASPDLIFLADACCGESPETVAARDGWGNIAAVTNGNVIPLDGDVASRWGPRIVDFFRVVVDAVKAASLVAPG